MDFIHFFRFGLCFLALTAISCEDLNSNASEGKEDEIPDIEIVDGKVKFFVSEVEDGPRAAAGVKSRLTKINVNGKDYTPVKEADGSLSVTVEASLSGEYVAVWTNSLSSKWYEGSAIQNVKLPYSQFRGITDADLPDFPLYAAYSRETGNRLIFKDAFAMIDLALEGDAVITSVNVRNRREAMMAGLVSFKPSEMSFRMSRGLAFANLNCTAENGGTALAGAGPVHFCIMVCPGVYPEGFEIRVCDSSHRMIEFTTEPVTLGPGELLSINKRYEPQEDLLYYEGFDNFVWGGDYVGGEAVPGFAAVPDEVTIDSSTDLSGYEESFSPVSFDSPGTGYVQSNTWDECNSTSALRRTVASSHQLSESWVKSRSIADFINLFRCQERPGYIEVGGAATTRGIVKTGKSSFISTSVNGRYSFDVCLKADFDDKLEIVIEEGGIIRGCRVNGQALDLSRAEFDAVYKANLSHIFIPAEFLTKAGSHSAAKTWDHIEVDVDGVTSSSSLYVTSASSYSGNHGFCLDNIRLVRTSVPERGTLRVLSWNIQNGMWADQANNYDDFVKFVKKYDPDICIWCEASSIYKDGTTVSAPAAERFLPDGWPALAARYGHSYTAIGGFRDNFPQVVTSRYPITTLKKITDTDVSGKPVAHGAGLHSISVRGREIYVATLHTWPQSYGYGVKTADREASSANHEGDYQRQHEMRYVIANTRNSSEYSAQADWIFAGDFNSRSRIDNWFYNLDEASTALITQDEILENTDYVDVIAEGYKGHFISSTQGNSRIDYVYMSPSLYRDVKSACTVMDIWTLAYKAGTTGFYYPSDHRPVMVDLQF